MDNMDIAEVTVHENEGEIPVQEFGRPFYGGFHGGDERPFYGSYRPFYGGDAPFYGGLGGLGLY
jgi:hypothetical protein